MSRRGFTLIEMLVASMVFIIGFISVFSLFLAGLKFRAQGDLQTRSAIALRNLVEEIQLDAGHESNAPVAPEKYLGTGFVDSPSTNTSTAEWHACPGMSGLYYSVVEATDVSGSTTNDKAPVLYLRILVLAFASTEDPLSMESLAKRLAIKVTDTRIFDLPITQQYVSDFQKYLQELIDRGIVTDNHVAILRQPSWMKDVTQ